jgi:polar amino acid transport system substrate-binding protein
LGPAVANVNVAGVMRALCRRRGSVMCLSLSLAMLMTALLIGPTCQALAGSGDNGEAVSKRPVIVAIQYDQTYTMKDRDGKWTGPMVDFWDLIAQELKQPYTFREMSLSSIMTALQEGTIDVAAISMFITSEREERFDFSTPMGEERHTLVTPYQTRREHPWMAVVSTFFSWGTLAVIVMLLSVLLFLGVSIWLIERRSNRDNFDQTFGRGVGAGIYWAGSTLASGLCFGIYLKTVPGRILGLAWMIICGLALSAVIASLTHSLTDQLQEMQVIEDTEFRYMHLGVKKGSVQVDMLKEAGGYYTLFDTDEGAMDALLNGQIDGYLCVEIRANFYANNQYKGKISVYPTKLRPYLYALAMPMQSPLRRPINVAVLKLMDESAWESLLDRYGLTKVSGGSFF